MVALRCPEVPVRMVPTVLCPECEGDGEALDGDPSVGVVECWRGCPRCSGEGRIPAGTTALVVSVAHAPSMTDADIDF